MKTDTSRRNNETAWLSSQSLSSRTPTVVFALAVSVCAVYAAANGPTLWSAAQRLKAEELQREDRMFCEKFHMPPGSESFATCAIYLSSEWRPRLPAYFKEHIWEQS
jgi:hypothetical protein